METRKTDYDYKNIIELSGTQDTTRKFMANVFMWMFVALGISAAMSYIFSHDQSLLQLLFNPETNSRTIFGTIVMFSPLGFVLMSFGINKLSYPVLLLLFITFAALFGISLSFIFLVYTSALISTVFLTTSLVFGVMAVAGYTTHTDLTKFGSILIMALFGIIIASFVNFFMNSEQLDYIISYIGVAVFVGLTAYDVQKLKRIGEGIEYGSASAGKMAIMGALTLYLDFINLFLMLLRVFGGGRRR
ncbi:Bax inhibitor-1/YccA family protein [Mucilaginibacter arboris]|uniref:BAX inhibitor (BI)-1/YccA family protein n=1 Tax=Mucilaginibacter arboris TaxID=2682090 RepID=A0A7K1SRI9_9SPHI|nr:Bax inhibitor-1/YccA family protein [Mucilaginibacter arboris]MVN19913.1 BAX inhibitor (BI)-1/YccA family protein [Mucilaginibacter arboris]